jgi:hypothetical protein
MDATTVGILTCRRVCRRINCVLRRRSGAYRVFQTPAERPDPCMSRSLRHQSAGGSGGEFGASAATASPCVAAALQLTSRQASRLPRRSTARQQSGADTASGARCRAQVYLRIQRATGQGCCSARVENSDRGAPIAGAAAALAGRRRRPRPLLTSLPARPSQVFQSSSAATTRAGRTCQHRGLQRTVRFSEADAGGFRFLTYAGPAVEVM